MCKNSNQWYFRIKTEYTAELDNGELQKTKIEELALAGSYTEAEVLANALAEAYGRRNFGDCDIEITRTRISEVIDNEILSPSNKPIAGFCERSFEEGEDSGVGLYAVKTVIIEEDPKNGKEKRRTESFYVPASSNADASKRVDAHLEGSMSEYVIRDAKFDRAEAIFWPADYHLEENSCGCQGQC